jgi:hypothetical protein
LSASDFRKLSTFHQVLTSELTGGEYQAFKAAEK